MNLVIPSVQFHSSIAVLIEIRQTRTHARAMHATTASNRQQPLYGALRATEGNSILDASLIPGVI
ncbi:hypothetical protein HDF08_002295 [Edaphobacter lichenicola]|uniref:Uncharacterized protein n=1 Tax=Tunturiibacter lichenicola TaxID=2051959 RepID=A0A852VBD6_9BACT|nr:hypothetical protein [Edaphobacter lichenicola]